MVKNIVETLIRKNVIQKNTELEVAVQRRDLAGRLINSKEIVTVNEICDVEPRFSCTNNQTGQALNASFEDVLQIDGMQPLRFASIYNVGSNGEMKDPGKKRGRKPKIKSSLT